MPAAPVLGASKRKRARGARSAMEVSSGSESEAEGEEGDTPGGLGVKRTRTMGDSAPPTAPSVGPSGGGQSTISVVVRSTKGGYARRLLAAQTAAQAAVDGLDHARATVQSALEKALEVLDAEMVLAIASARATNACVQEMVAAGGTRAPEAAAQARVSARGKARAEEKATEEGEDELVSD
jgi:hypothetical protein